ncbi:uncharacterized protein [Littorina saxatilis]|uniref:Uncharacterized protein n=1 Tax=Littorina saxatilis TaxID=31220 RepID=A0AAN9GPL9_9CAEN
MPRSGGRLNLAGAINRNIPPNYLTPLNNAESGCTSKHASVCRLERELKAVKEENGRLKEQLEDTRSALKQITVEASYEKFDERRVNMLKMQIIQLQKQLLLMSEALGSRSTALTEVENALTWLSGKFRHYIGAEVKGAEVPVPRSDLMTMVDTSESARIKLFKNIENCTTENLAQPHMFMNSFLKPGCEKEFTILDCCLAKTESLNLKQVAQLESKLSTLYKELIKVSENLTDRGRANQDPAAGHMSSAVQEREGTVILKASAMARDCAADLLSLSLLVPSAPWPPLKKPTMSEVTYDALAPSLPPLPRGKAAEVQRCVTAALKACNHRCHMVGQEASALREEVRFHQAVYQLQLDYVLQAFDALRDGYKEFEHSTNEVLIQPMKKLMEAYTKLKKNTSQQGLKTFLTVLKEHEQQWTDVIQKLDTCDPQNQSGAEALSVFGQEFLTSLDRLLLSRQTERDKVASRKEELKTAQQQLEEDLRALIRDGEEQQRIASDLKGENSSNNADASGFSYFSGLPDSVRCEGIGEGRSMQNDFNSKRNITGMKKGKKTQRGSSMSRQPWLDLGDGAEDNAGRRRKSRDEQMEPESEASVGLRPWLDQPLTDNGEKLPEWNFGGTSPRPWPHENTAAERVAKKTHSQNERRNRSDPASGDLGAQALAYMPDSVHTLEQIVRASADELENMVRENSSRASTRTPAGLLQYQEMQALNSQRSLLDYRRHSPSDKGFGNNINSRESVYSQMDSYSQFQQAHNHHIPFQPDTDIPGIKPASDKPPCSANLTTDHASKKEKGRAKPKNYEPKLYVANRTLSLRRSGSLTKLAEPSLEERMVKMSVSGPRNNDSSRTNSRKSNR